MPTPEITIKDWYKGMSSSPHTYDGAIAKSVNLDIFNYPGVVRGNFQLFNYGGSTITGQVRWTVPYFSTTGTYTYFALDNSNKVYKSTDGGRTWSVVTHTGASSGHGNGMAIWKDYLFVAGDDRIDVYGPLSGTPSWTNDFKGLNGNPTAHQVEISWHPMLASSQDNILYIGDLFQLASLQEVSGKTFNPGDNSTFTWNPTALSIPMVYSIRCLTELRQNILIGTYQGYRPVDSKKAAIFPWNRSGTSAYMSFDYPIIIYECGIHAMKNIDDQVYIVAGNEGKLFKLTESNLTYLGKPPIDLRDGFIEVYPDAIESIRGRVFVGYSSSDSSPLSFIPGIYSYDQNSGKFNIENLVSNLAISNVVIGSLCYNGGYYSGESFLVGWKSGSGTGAKYGIDSVNSWTYYSPYTSYFETQLFQVGSVLEPANYSQVEIQLSKPLVSGDGIRIRMRKDLDTPFGTGNNDSDILATITSDNYKSASILAPCRITGVSQFQLRVEFKGSAEIIEMTLVPST